MSHLSCPLCGLNVPLNFFDPESLDLDLKLVSFRGLGRGKGFERSDTQSVLGDEHYSPMVADRVLKLCKLFLDTGTLSGEQALERLGLRDEPLKSGKYVTKEVYDKSILQTLIYIDRYRREKEKLERVEFRLGSLEYDIEEKEKERKRERFVERILRLILKSCDAEIVEDGNAPWILVVNRIDGNGFLVLCDILLELRGDIRERLRLRLKGGDSRTQLILEEVLLKKKKTTYDRLLEIDLNELAPLPKKRKIIYL